MTSDLAARLVDHAQALAAVDGTDWRDELRQMVELLQGPAPAFTATSVAGALLTVRRLGDGGRRIRNETHWLLVTCRRQRRRSSGHSRSGSYGRRGTATYAVDEALWWPQGGVLMLVGYPLTNARPLLDRRLVLLPVDLERIAGIGLVRKRPARKGAG